jgi:hypothetical protein
LDVRFFVACVFDVIFEFLTLKMTYKTLSTGERTSKMHIQNASVINPYMGKKHFERFFGLTKSSVSAEQMDAPEREWEREKKEREKENEKEMKNRGHIMIG